MTPFAIQFDNAQNDNDWYARYIVEEDDDGEDDFITHMKIECRMGRFV